MFVHTYTHTYTHAHIQKTGTKFSTRLGNLVPNLAVRAVRLVTRVLENKKLEIDIKRYVRIEKVSVCV